MQSFLESDIAMIFTCVASLFLIAALSVPYERFEKKCIPSFWMSLFLVLSLVVASAPFGHFLAGQEDTPYNVREVLSKAPWAILPFLSVGIALFGLITTGLAEWWKRHRLSYSLAVIPLHMIGAGVAFYVLYSVIPDESIWDILGYPSLDIGYRNELALRFMGWLAAPVGMITLGTRLSMGKLKPVDCLVAIPNVLMAIAGYLVVVRFANTDNIVELMNGQGNWIACVTIAAFLFILGFVIGKSSAFFHRVVRFDPIALGALILLTTALVPLGWQALVWAGEDSIEKYDLVFSTRQFLLGPNRTDVLDEFSLFQRYLVAFLPIVSVLIASSSLSMAVVSRFIVREHKQAHHRSVRRPTTDDSASSTRVGELIPVFASAVLLNAFIILAGSFAPFDLSPIEFREAAKSFQEILTSPDPADIDMLDFGINFAVAVPLSFFGLSLFCERFGRSVASISIGSILVLVVSFLITLASEFGQVWLAGRFSSFYDVAAQSLGSILGVVLWLALGSTARRWLIQLPFMSTTRDRRMWILHGYLVALFAEMIFPVDAMTSKVEIWEKYNNHGFEMLPFSRGFDSVADGAFAILFGLVKYIPIGIYACTVNRSQRQGSRAVSESLFWGFFVVLLFEACQLLMFTRLTSSTDIVMGFLGVAIGVGGWKLWQFKQSHSHTSPRVMETTAMEMAAPWLLASIAYAALIAFAQWSPYELLDEQDYIVERFESFASLPFTDWKADKSAALRLSNLARLAVGLPLGLLLGMACFRPSFNGEAKVAMVGITGGLLLCVPMAIEGAQVVIHGKFPSTTHGALAAFGGLVGWSAAAILVGVRQMQGKISIETIDQTEPQTATTKPGGWIPGFDGLRATACLGVFGVHFQQLTEVDANLGPFELKRLLLNGNTGVAIFFLLSGFLISMPIWNSSSDNPCRSALSGFALRRIARIFPAYYICLLGLILIVPGLPSVFDIVMHLTFMHSLTDATFYSINSPFWTISIQMQFYLLFALVLMILAQLNIGNKKTIMWLFVALGFVSYFVHMGILMSTSSPSAQAGLPEFLSPDGAAITRSLIAHLPIFCLGMFASYLANTPFLKVEQQIWDIVFAGAAGLALLILATPIDDLAQIPGGRYNLPFVPVLLTVMIIAAPRSQVVARILESAPLRLLGVISYGFYVYHYPCLKAVNRVLNELEISGDAKLIALCIGGLLMSVVISAASYAIIEKPLLKATRRKPVTA